MDFLNIDTASPETVKESFTKIAEMLFNDYQLQVNDNFYRLIDIEFYYHSLSVHEDVYTHGEDVQSQKGKWYFHNSGIDITIGNGKDHGGILIRAIAKLHGEATYATNYIQKEIHGPINVSDELLKNFNGPFDNKPNIFQLNNISQSETKSKMVAPKLIASSKRIGLKLNIKDKDGLFMNSDYRYVVFWDNHNLKYKNREAIVSSLLSNKKIEMDFANKILNYTIKK